MKDENKPKEQLINELAELRRRIAELEASEAERLSAERAGKRAEEALRESEERYRTLFESAPVGIGLGASGGQLLAWNETLLRMTGYPETELGRIGLEEMYNNPKDRALLYERLQADGSVSDFETVLKRKDGTPYHVGITINPITVGGERVFLAAVKDITQRVRAEEALRESQERLDNFINSATEGFTLFDSQLNYVEINRAALAVGGTKKEEVIGRNVIDFIPDIKETGRYDNWIEVIKTGKPLIEEDVLVHPRYGEICLDIRAFKVGGGLGVITTNITERKRAEEALQESEELLRKVLETLPIGVWIADKDGAILHGNPAGQQIWAGARYVGPEQFGEYKAWWLDTGERITPDEWGIARAISKGKESLEEEIEIECFDGTHKIILNWAVPIFGPNQEIEGAIAVNQDITDRKRAEEQIQASLREKTVLLREIHHRVKNNLAVVSSLLDFQSETIEDEQARAAFQESQNRIHSMARIHEHLYRSKDLARVDMAEYIQGLVGYLAQSYSTYGITVAIEATDVVLDIDTALPCGLILNELGSNALKYAFPSGVERPSQPGQVRIAMRSDGGQVELTVSDNGVGLPVDLDLENVESLGLRLVHILTRQLKGTLEVERGEGTTFRLAFAAPQARS